MHGFTLNEKCALELSVYFHFSLKNLIVIEYSGIENEKQKKFNRCRLKANDTDVPGTSLS